MEEKKQKRKLSFTNELFKIGWPLNMIDGVVMYIYVLMASGVYYQLSPQELHTFTIAMLIITGITQFGPGFLSNYVLTRKLSQRIKKEEQGYYTARERTDLIKDLTKFPSIIALEVDGGFLLAFIAATVYISLNFTISPLRMLFYTMMCMEGITTAGIFAHLYTEVVCSRYVEVIASHGISRDVIEKEHHWGLKLNTKIFLFIIVPYIFVCLSEIVFMLFNPIIEGNFSIKSLMIVVIASTFYIALIIFYLHQQIYTTAVKINKSLTEMQKFEQEDECHLPMSFNSELNYNTYLINQIIDYMQGISKEANRCAQTVNETTQQLLETSQMSEASVTEKIENIKLTIGMIQHTLESLNQTNNFIQEINEATVNSKISIENCSRNLVNYKDKILLIQNSNSKTNEAISSFSERIETAWSIINKIEDFAQKTKIIAYNAELEADTNGIKGDKFHIIAMEIRRLSLTIEDASEQIKEKIISIQNSSDNLIIKSEAGTLKIQEENKTTAELNANFKELVTCDNITHESTIKIENCLSEQKNIIDKMNNTLTEVNNGFDYFEESSKRINSVSQNLSLISKQLNGYRKGKKNNG